MAHPTQLDPAQIQAPSTFDIGQAYRQYAPLVRGFANKMVTNWHDAEDVTQDAFLAALTATPEHVQKPAAWLSAIAEKRALRSNSRRAAAGIPTDFTDCSWAEAVEAPVNPHVYATDADDARTAAQLGEALAMLTATQRAAVELRHLEGLPLPQVGERLGVTTSAATDVVRVAMRKMQAVHGDAGLRAAAEAYYERRREYGRAHKARRAATRAAKPPHPAAGELPSPRQREALALYATGLTCAQVGKRMGVTGKAAKALVGAGRQRLQRAADAGTITDEDRELLAAAPARHASAPAAGGDGLTPRQRQVIGMADTGLTDADIAARLGVTVSAVWQTRVRACRKLGRSPQRRTDRAMDTAYDKTASGSDLKKWAEQLVDHWQAAAPADTAADTLTPRQRQVMALLDDGLRPADVARRLGVSVETVCNHRAAAERRQGVTRRQTTAEYVAELVGHAPGSTATVRVRAASRTS